MLNQINIYLIVGLLAVVLILGGGWYLNRSWDAATIDTLEADKIRLTDAVEQSGRNNARMIFGAKPSPHHIRSSQAALSPPKWS